MPKIPSRVHCLLCSLWLDDESWERHEASPRHQENLADKPLVSRAVSQIIAEIDEAEGLESLLDEADLTLLRHALQRGPWRSDGKKGLDPLRFNRPQKGL
jgi:hypothetical protein